MNCVNCKKPVTPVLRKEGQGGLREDEGTVLGRAKIYYCCKSPGTRVPLMDWDMEDRVEFGRESEYYRTINFKIPK